MKPPAEQGWKSLTTNFDWLQINCNTALLDIIAGVLRLAIIGVQMIINPRNDELSEPELLDILNVILREVEKRDFETILPFFDSEVIYGGSRKLGTHQEAIEAFGGLENISQLLYNAIIRGGFLQTSIKPRAASRWITFPFYTSILDILRFNPFEFVYIHDSTAQLLALPDLSSKTLSSVKFELVKLDMVNSRCLPPGYMKIITQAGLQGYVKTSALSSALEPSFSFACLETGWKIVNMENLRRGPV